MRKKEKDLREHERRGVNELKKIMHIVEAFGGGIFTFLADISNYISKEYEVIILYSEREETPKDFEKFFNSNIKFIKLKYLKKHINIKNDLMAIKEIKQIIKKEKPDIVHLHSSKAGIIGRIVVNDKNIKLIYNPHGFSFLMKNISRPRKLMYWILEKIAATRKCTIVGCSTGEYNEARKLTKNTICINNGINIEQLKSLDKCTIDLKNLRICTAARIDYQKDPELFNKLANQYPNIQFTWIGDGKLKEILNSPNIKVTGWKSREEALEILNDNDIFILTSLWEGLPISLLEAMYLEKVCLVTNVIGNRDVINDKVNGFVCDNEIEFKRTIDEIISNKYNLRDIVKNAGNDVKRLYDIEQVWKKYKKIYEAK